MSGRAALWFVLQKYVVEAGALQQGGLSRLIGLTFSGDLGGISSCVNEVIFVVAAGNCCRKCQRRM